MQTKTFSSSAMFGAMFGGGECIFTVKKEKCSSKFVLPATKILRVAYVLCTITPKTLAFPHATTTEHKNNNTFIQIAVQKL